MFLYQEQQILERMPVVLGGLQTNAEDLDAICLQYGARRKWPTTLSQRDRDAVVQRFEWARTLSATMLFPFRKADGTETGRMLYPDWEFEPMMIWFLVETWRTAENLRKPDGVLASPLPQRPEPQWPPGPESN